MRARPDDRLRVIVSRYPGATWRGPIPNQTTRGMGTVLGVVLHIMQGSLAGTDSWFHNRKAQASAHFGVGKTGRVYQWVDTADKAWAEVGGNGQYLSIEHEGNSGDALTAQQIAADAGIIAWAHGLYHFPLQLANRPGEHGLGYHAMGGVAWGNHPQCPGAPIIAQRQRILDAITKPAPPPAPVQEDDMAVAVLTSSEAGANVGVVAGLAFVIQDPKTLAEVGKKAATYDGVVNITKGEMDLVLASIKAAK